MSVRDTVFDFFMEVLMAMNWALCLERRVQSEWITGELMSAMVSPATAFLMASFTWATIISTLSPKFFEVALSRY